MDPHLVIDLAESAHRERVAWIEAHGWELAEAPRRPAARRPREVLAMALLALAVRLAPSVAGTIAGPHVAGAPQA